MTSLWDWESACDSQPIERAIGSGAHRCWSGRWPSGRWHKAHFGEGCRHDLAIDVLGEDVGRILRAQDLAELQLLAADLVLDPEVGGG